MSNPRKRIRDYCYTINHYGPGERDRLPDIPCKYHVFAEEIGETGTPHIQGYICFEHAKTMSAVSKILPRAHLEFRRGTHKEASDYCKKTGDFKEIGTLPMTQTEKGATNKFRFARACELAISRDLLTLMDESPHIFLAHYSTILKIGRDYNKRPPDLPHLNNYWVYGEPATGKSAFCNQLGPNVYIKSCNKWFISYQDQPIIHVNDFGLEHKCLGYYLKIWADLYPFIYENKGGGSWCRPEIIAVSSNYHPRDIWPDDPQIQKAIERRFHIIHAQRNDLVNTFGHLFRSEAEAERDFFDREPDAPIGPGPGPQIFEPSQVPSEMSQDDSLTDIVTDIHTVCNAINNGDVSLNNVSLDDCLLDPL